ncbi:MAG: YbaK/EbsC family protein [Verrucomicrobia subdivision 3 bacterium]|nr:YbaK/EbsC family protein [Limisphaerales bacterium]
MPARKLKEFLDSNHVKYVQLTHSPAYTAQEVAAMAHIPGKEMAKTVMVKIKGKLAMAVLPANRKVVLQDLRDITGDESVTLASEAEFQSAFPDCEPGAMPPFGPLYGMDVYVSPSLAADEEIAFNAGTHTEVIKMAYRDFERLVHPRVVSFST